MFKRKCPGCREKVERKFNFCPYCGKSFKEHDEQENFGMIGRDDIVDLERQARQEIKLPFGLNKIMGSLMKKLEKEMSELDGGVGTPKGFKIQISTGMPHLKRIMPEVRRGNLDNKTVTPEISDEELERRRKLLRVEAKSVIRRLADKIVYEICVPGVKSNKDIVIARLENSIEIKAYSKDKCYFKIIPLKIEVIGFYLKDEKVFLELKN